MYKMYFFNDEGRYQAPVYLDADSVLVACFRFLDAVPKIQVTNSSDESVFESSNGLIEFPVFGDGMAEKLKKAIGPFVQEHSLSQMIREYKDLMETYIDSDGAKAEVFKAMTALEMELLAVGAKESIDLQVFGWKNSGIVEAETEARMA